jgi:hypothetical protein
MRHHGHSTLHGTSIPPGGARLAISSSLSTALTILALLSHMVSSPVRTLCGCRRPTRKSQVLSRTPLRCHQRLFLNSRRYTTLPDSLKLTHCPSWLIVPFRQRMNVSGSNQPRQWLDLSQLSFNRYFLDLLTDRVQLKLGRCDITLQPGPPTLRISKATTRRRFREIDQIHVSHRTPLPSTDHVYPTGV